LHEDGEVALSVSSHGDINADSVLRLAGSRGSDVHNKELVVSVGGFLLGEAEETVVVSGHVSDGHLGEASGIDLHDLSLVSLERVELALSLNLVSLTCVESDEVAPLAVRTHVVAHDLAISHIGVSVEDLLGLVGALVRSGLEVAVVHGVLADESKLVVGNPGPERDLLLADELAGLGTLVEVVALNDGSHAGLIRTDYDHVACAMHDLSFNGHGLALKLEALASIDHEDVVSILDRDVFLRLKRQNVVFEQSGVEAESRQVEDLSEFEGEVLLSHCLNATI